MAHAFNGWHAPRIFSGDSARRDDVNSPSPYGVAPDIRSVVAGGWCRYFLGADLSGKILLLIILFCLAGCTATPLHPKALPLPAGGDALAVLEESPELIRTLPGYGTVNVVVLAGEGVDAESFDLVKENLSNEVSACLRSTSRLMVVSAKVYADLQLKVVVNALDYVSFTRRLSGLALFKQAVLGTDLELIDLYYGRTVWKLRTYSVSRLGEGMMAASTTTQVLGLCQEFSGQLKKGN